MVHRAQSPVPPRLPHFAAPPWVGRLATRLQALTHYVATQMHRRPGWRRCRAHATGLSPAGAHGLECGLPSRCVGAWRCAPLLPWRMQCPVGVSVALAAGQEGVVGATSRPPPLQSLSRLPPGACGGLPRPSFPCPRVPFRELGLVALLLRTVCPLCVNVLLFSWCLCLTSSLRLVARLLRTFPLQGGVRATPCDLCPSAFPARLPCSAFLEGEGHSPAPASSTAADQIGPPGRQVTTGPPQPPAPNLQPEDMPSILPAVAAAEAAARKPARITAQPASTTSSSSSASSTSSASSSDPPLPAALIHKATAKAKVAAARTDPPTPTQATQAPRQRTRKTPDPTSAPSHLLTEVLLNLEPDPNLKPDPRPKPAPTRAHTTPQTQRHKPNRHHPNADPRADQDPPPTTTHAPLPPAPTTTAEAATQHDPVQALVHIPVTKRPVIHPPQTTTTAGKTNPGTWDPSTTVSRRKKKNKKMTHRRKNKAKNRPLRPQKPPKKLYASVWRGRKI